MQRLRHGKSPPAFQNRPQDHGVIRHIPVPPGHELDGAGSLHFVIILALNPLPRTQVGAPQEAVQESAVILRFAQHGFVEPSGLRRQPMGFKLPLRERLP